MSLKPVTLAQVLQRAGYSTGIFGKWHLGDEASYQPGRRGFDEVFIHGAGGIGQSFAGSCGDAPGSTYVNPVILHNGRFEKTCGYCTDVFFGRAIEWLDRQRSTGAPYFAFITANAAHAPLVVPENYFARHRGQVTDEEAKFFGMIENLDDNFGRLLAKLDEWSIAENTLVIFLTDNGGTVGTRLHNSGMRGAKNSPYQGGTRVPSLWRWPLGMDSTGDVAALTAHIDIFPTLAEIAGVSLEGVERGQVEGRSLLPLLRDPTAEWPERFLVTHCGRWPRGGAGAAKYSQCSIRNSRFTLVNNSELYDLKNDRGERSNVIVRFPQVAERLRSAYDRWWSDVLPCLENEDATGPAVNPFKALYLRQFGGASNSAAQSQ
jgi:arylsulfatase